MTTPTPDEICERLERKIASTGAWMTGDVQAFYIDICALIQQQQATIERLSALVEESLYHLRLDEAAKAHNAGCSASTTSGTISMQPDIPTPDEICERLRASAEHAAKALQIMADAKTARQTDRDDYPEVRAMVGGYGAPTKEQTLEWKAADLIQQQLAEIERLSAALERAGRVGDIVRLGQDVK